MNHPQNPHAAESRAAIQAYAAQMRGEAVAPEQPPVAVVSAPAPPAPAATLVARVLAQWPDMARYAETARIERVYDPQRDCWREAVTVTVVNHEA